VAKARTISTRQRFYEKRWESFQPGTLEGRSIKKECREKGKQQTLKKHKGEGYEGKEMLPVSAEEIKFWGGAGFFHFSTWEEKTWVYVGELFRQFQGGITAVRKRHLEIELIASVSSTGLLNDRDVLKYYSRAMQGGSNMVPASVRLDRRSAERLSLGWRLAPKEKRKNRG